MTKTNFLINGHLASHYPNKAIYLFEADSSGFKVVDSALVQNDWRFNFIGYFLNPQIYKLVVDHNHFNLII